MKRNDESVVFRSSNTKYGVNVRAVKEKDLALVEVRTGKDRQLCDPFVGALPADTIEKGDRLRVLSAILGMAIARSAKEDHERKSVLMLWLNDIVVVRP